MDGTWDSTDTEKNCCPMSKETEKEQLHAQMCCDFPQNEERGKSQHMAQEGNLTRKQRPQQQISAEHEKTHWTEFVFLLESTISFVLRQGGSRGQREVREHLYIILVNSHLH